MLLVHVLIHVVPTLSFSTHPVLVQMELITGAENIALLLGSVVSSPSVVMCTRYKGWHNGPPCATLHTVCMAVGGGTVS